jgi:5-methylcytosine-specific restriction endonuclease McrA
MSLIECEQCGSFFDIASIQKSRLKLFEAYGRRVCTHCINQNRRAYSRGYCAYCGVYKNLTKDHIIPRSRGGADIKDNITMVCSRCNSAKGNKTLEEWLDSLPADAPQVVYLRSILSPS